MTRHYYGERIVTPEERALWERVARGDTLLRPASLPADQRLGPSSAQRLPPLIEGSSAGLDARTAQRLRSGRYPAGRILDWHGYTQERAFEELKAAIKAMSEQDGRALIVITGKGRAGGGVLKERLGHWLNDPAIRPFVLAFARANPKDSGAYRILLKRRRDGRAYSGDR